MNEVLMANWLVIYQVWGTVNVLPCRQLGKLGPNKRQKIGWIWDLKESPKSDYCTMEEGGSPKIKEAHECHAIHSRPLYRVWCFKSPLCAPGVPAHHGCPGGGPGAGVGGVIVIPGASQTMVLLWRGWGRRRGRCCNSNISSWWYDDTK